jgi:DNA helicase-2/ATP-dependent DNA helicase PcrA
VVFLVGLEEGVFPHARSIGQPAEEEEERRLCYVALTRARRRLFCSSALTRNLWGSSQSNPPSRFLDEIPAELVVQEGGPSDPEWRARILRQAFPDRARHSGQAEPAPAGPARWRWASSPRT